MYKSFKKTNKQQFSLLILLYTVYLTSNCLKLSSETTRLEFLTFDYTFMVYKSVDNGKLSSICKLQREVKIAHL